MWKWVWGVIILVAILEIYLFDLVAGNFGGAKALLLTLFTSAIGYVMMRFEGKKVLEDARIRMNNGQIPGRTLIDGLCIFIGGFLLVIPGFFLDFVGFTMVFPLTRPVYRIFILRWLKNKMKNGNVKVYRN
ncbi:FxsA family protein [Paenibacillus crassostreae]|uniref:Exlusion protein FxsA n=1 Tax=Paenibacillus crassostreae TaxID=1763538 RepID=A0A167G128_9BACL|nr:FxsA family protein [Paenibacillus crassostreae]AOZ93867.1 membrane protein FxsA [Paenibacillus crassostreae]OAB77100.1 exlusion protein FxsA [Paenibacillus crassostreae]